MTQNSSLDERAYFSLLQRSSYIRCAEDHLPLSGGSNLHLDGLVVLAYSDRSLAEQKAAESTGSLGRRMEAQPFAALWDSIMDFCRRGFCGMLLDEASCIHFLNRFSDMDRRLPTLASFSTVGEEGLSTQFHFGIRGLADVDPRSLLPWADYGRLDRLCRQELTNDDIRLNLKRVWVFVPKDDQTLLLFGNGATFLGPYVSASGAAPVFSHEGYAGNFARRERLDPTKIDLVEMPLVDFLNDYYARRRLWGFIDYGLNPMCHRFRQGHFWRENAIWFLRTLFGVFEVSQEGLEPRSDVLPPKGSSLEVISEDGDMLGVSSVTLYPLKRLFGSNQSRVSEDEAQEILDQELAIPFEPSDHKKGLSDVTIDSFMLTGFDKVMGTSLEELVFFEPPEDTHDFPPTFPDIIAACRFLWHTALDLDEQVRRDGYSTCEGRYVRGSGDADSERRYTKLVQTAIRRMLQDVLVRGYRPEHAQHLRRLFGDVSQTFEITEAGYVGDLVFYDETPYFQATSDCPNARKFEAKVQSWREKVVRANRLDPQLLIELRRGLGPAIDGLSEDSLVIAAAAIEEYRTVGQRPKYDYAGISMKISKVVERELKNRVFVAWRDHVKRMIGAAGVKEMRIAGDSDFSFDRTGSLALDWLEEKRKVTLGEMPYCLSAVRKGSAHPAIASFGVFIGGFRDPQFLVSEQLEGALRDISTKYRNGGVHEYVVTFDICREAFDRLLFGQDPLLRRLLDATRPKM